MVWSLPMPLWRWLALAVLVCTPMLSRADGFAWDIEGLPTHSLGRQIQLLRDYGGTWTVVDAQQRFADLNPPAPRDEVLSLGIGSPTVWLRLPLHNAQPESVRRHLLLGTTWLDSADVYLVRAGQVMRKFHLGDEGPYAYGVVPGFGFTWELDLPPQRSELLVRVQSMDPLVLPLQLLDAQALAEQRDRVQYSYELMFGALFALMLYNLALFLVVRNPLHGRYALYVGSMLVMCIAYTGKGLSAWWPDSPGFQRYFILCTMVAFNMAGLNFAVHLLRFRQQHPHWGRALLAAQWATAGVMGYLVLADWHLWAVWWAFLVFLACMLILFAFGVWALRTRQPYGKIFFAAVSISMAGAASAWLSVVGVLGYTTLQFRAMEAGFLLDAALLAIALGRTTAARPEQAVGTPHP
ncbi:7TM diverse intracellular signaling domain-containing protein [Curvibacter sp. APW13]|uniref:7TMR-DISM family protein n=1 Tax=Curvibacter sp. APW13 TaxID=3077236 RepID=UPI0028DF25D5|nr:7TM diverse intracellular signaling domain-containing protein [Curvibacter sp. APW13]MDT8990254.1 7TM diverse intracellular signaling domain-containing protein [Curvibacter sp. APW13]